MKDEFIESSDHLAHYGILHKSGRYPWGSGSTPNKRNRDFLAYFDQVRADGKMTITEACQMLGISTTEFRAARTIANAQQKQQQIRVARKLRDEKGWSHTAIAEKMFGSKSKESTVRALLAADAADKVNALHNIANMLEEGVAKYKYLDVGTGVEQHLGIAESRLKAAVAILKEKGYFVTKVQVDQLGTAPGNKTTIRTLAPKGATYKEVNANRLQIRQLDALGKFSKDGGKSILGIAPPLSISSKRIGINYGEDGGGKADGVIYVRPGVNDLSLGAAHYAQVRIMVDNSHFMKGMAVYKDDLPRGVDLQFNTAKDRAQIGTNKLDALKELKTKDDGTIDHDNPFGAQLKVNGQILDEHGKATSAMNKINEEGDWETWSKNLSSQFLSKQSPNLAKKQLDQTYDEERNGLQEIMALTNPTVRRKLLESFADGADSSAVHLKAAALPGQASHVILPVNKMKETEIYAPNFTNGDRVVLVRYPHGGTFEIPELTVNNKHPEARKAFGDHPPDAIGINPNVAKKLSGADFDGDSVIVIKQKPGTLVKSKDSLEELKHFDPQKDYAPYDGMTTIDGGKYDAATGKVDFGGRKPQPNNKQNQMGKVSNLITDMTIRGASNDKIARAVKHSMVVIDAEKHKLDYKQSEIDNGIKALRQEFQPRPPGRPAGGASTLISRATSRKDIRAVKPRPAKEGGPVDPLTGKKVFVPKGEDFVDKNGKLRSPTQRTTKLADAEDAFTLTSGGSKENPGTKIEAVYAEHSNRMKDLANLARKEAVNTTVERAVPAATKAYADEVKSLNSALANAIRNRPLERQAQIYANETLAQKKIDLPDMDEAQMKRVRFQALQQARSRTGADKDVIVITEPQWKAIQARAISPSKLKTILDNADLDVVKKLATPRQALLMSGSKLGRAQAMLNSGNTQAEVAQALGVSLTTLKNSLAGG